MERIPKIENILFFNQRINAYWCESQEDIDLCCQYFQECKRKENLLSTIIAKYYLNLSTKYL